MCPLPDPLWQGRNLHGFSEFFLFNQFILIRPCFPDLFLEAVQAPDRIRFREIPAERKDPFPVSRREKSILIRIIESVVQIIHGCAPKTSVGITGKIQSGVVLPALEQDPVRRCGQEQISSGRIEVQKQHIPSADAPDPGADED